VDLHEKRQLDLANQVARVRVRARPWRSIIALVMAGLAWAVWLAAHDGWSGWRTPGNVTPKIVTAAAAAAFCLFAVIALLGLAGKAREVLEPTVGSGHASVVRYSILLIGGATIFVLTLELLRFPVSQLVLGGAVTGILIGIAAQQSLANVFAGLVLLLSRPFSVGDTIRLRSGALAGQIEGQVTEIGITYVRLEAEDGPLHLPNSQVLAAAVGPVPRQPQELRPVPAQPQTPGPGRADSPDGYPPSGPS
jgi:small-conductance mechanosensitive channel